MKRCKGITMYIRRTMLGDEVRRCAACGAEYVSRFVMRAGVYSGEKPPISCAQLARDAGRRIASER